MNLGLLVMLTYYMARPSFTNITNNDRVYGNYRNHYDNQGLERIDIFNSLDVNC